MTTPMTPPPDAESTTFQARVAPWMQQCFGPEISADVVERCDRLIEEAHETAQSVGYPRERGHAIVDYVHDRPAGDPPQEVGGVMVTLAAFCIAVGLDMHQCGETELARVWTKVEQIRAKQAAKPKHSPLPIAVPAAQPTTNLSEMPEVVEDAARASWDPASHGEASWDEIGSATAEGSMGYAWRCDHLRDVAVWLAAIQPHVTALLAAQGEAHREELVAMSADFLHWRHDYTELQGVNRGLNATIGTLRSRLDAIADGAGTNTGAAWRAIAEHQAERGER